MKASVGNFVLVDPRHYYHGGKVWGKVRHIALGDAATYPVKVDFPNGLSGQFKFDEIYSIREQFVQSRDLVEMNLVCCERNGEKYYYGRTVLDGVPTYTAKMPTRADLLDEIKRFLAFFDLL